MLSARLVHLIESNWQEIATRLSRAVKSHPEMQSLARKSDADIRDWCQEILENLGYLRAHAEAAMRRAVNGDADPAFDGLFKRALQILTKS